jgi:hypothetical protein
MDAARARTPATEIVWRRVTRGSRLTRYRPRFFRDEILFPVTCDGTYGAEFCVDAKRGCNFS